MHRFISSSSNKSFFEILLFSCFASNLKHHEVAHTFYKQLCQVSIHLSCVSTISFRMINGLFKVKWDKSKVIFVTKLKRKYENNLLQSLKDQSQGNFPIFFVTNLAIHELLLDHQGNNIRWIFKQKTIQN